MATLRAALLAGLLVLSGCAAPGSPGDRAENGSPESVPSLAEVDLPPGVREDGTVPEPLLAAHGAALRDASHTVVREQVVRSTARNATARTVARFARDGRVLVVSTVTREAGPTDRMTLYAGTERIYRRTTAPDRLRYAVSERSAGTGTTLRRRFGSTAVVRSYLRVANFTPAGTRRVGGETVVVLRAGGDALRRAPGFPAADASNVSATMLVTPRGVVRRLTVEIRGSPGAALHRATLTLRVTAVGETTVERPDWLAEAGRAAGNATGG